jgi:uncharacterized protein (DUF305 family)
MAGLNICGSHHGRGYRAWRKLSSGSWPPTKAATDVKQFAQRMLTDHSQANEELKALAQKKNLATDLTPKHAALQDRLAKLSGRECDRDYMNATLQDHRMAVNEFRKEGQSGKDPEISPSRQDTSNARRPLESGPTCQSRSRCDDG